MLHHWVLFEELGAADGTAVDILGAHPGGAMMHGWGRASAQPGHHLLARHVIPLNLLRAWNNTVGVRAGVSHRPRPDAGGRYTQWIGVVNANVEIEF